MAKLPSGSPHPLPLLLSLVRHSAGAPCPLARWVAFRTAERASARPPPNIKMPPPPPPSIIVYTAASHTASPPPPCPNVLRLLLVRHLPKRVWQAPANAAGRCPRQLRRDGETSARCRLRAVCRRVTRRRADYLVLRERCCGRHHVFPVVAHGGGGTRARVAALRMV